MSLAVLSQSGLRDYRSLFELRGRKRQKGTGGRLIPGTDFDGSGLRILDH